MTLQTFCPNCGAALIAGAGFCGSCGYQVAGGEAAGPTGEQLDLNYQVVVRRIEAALIDFIPLIIIFLLLAATIGEFGENEWGNFQVRLENGGFLLFLLLANVYYIGFEATTAATPGKMIRGLKVVKANGGQYGLGAVVIRNLLRFVDGFFFYLVAVITIAITKKRQRLGDLAAGTLVVATQ